MNKADLINEIHENVGINKTQASAVLEALIDGVSRALKGAGKVTLVGFGTFSTTTRGARTGRNPRTGAPIKIGAKTVAKFKPGKKLSDSLTGRGAKRKK